MSRYPKTTRWKAMDRITLKILVKRGLSDSNIADVLNRHPWKVRAMREKMEDRLE